MIVVLDDTRKLLDGSYILTRIKFCIIWIIRILIRVLDMFWTCPNVNVVFRFVDFVFNIYDMFGHVQNISLVLDMFWTCSDMSRTVNNLL